MDKGGQLGGGAFMGDNGKNLNKLDAVHLFRNFANGLGQFNNSSGPEKGHPGSGHHMVGNSSNSIHSSNQSMGGAPFGSFHGAPHKGMRKSDGYDQGGHYSLDQGSLHGMIAPDGVLDPQFLGMYREGQHSYHLDEGVASGKKY